VFDLQERLDHLSAHPALSGPGALVAKKQEKLDFLSESLYNNKTVCMEKFMSRLERRAALLDSLSPLRVLARGYSAVFYGKNLVRSAQTVEAGDALDIHMHDGVVKAAVTGQTDSGNGPPADSKTPRE
jgi:exodeoxyribonuclease VII large subunit